jgi:hypothetical protein
LPDGNQSNLTGHFLCFLLICTPIQLRSQNRNVISINQAVLVDISFADISFKISISFSQAGIIDIRSEIVFIKKVVIVNITGKITGSVRDFEYIQLPAGTKSACLPLRFCILIFVVALFLFCFQYNHKRFLVLLVF